MRWKEYLEKLYEGNDEAIENYVRIEEIYRVEDEIGPSIIKSEFIEAIFDLKSNKAVGIDIKTPNSHGKESFHTKKTATYEQKS